jgi:hypothetical protein
MCDHIADFWLASADCGEPVCTHWVRTKMLNFGEKLGKQVIRYNFSQKIRVISDIPCELNAGISLLVEGWRLLQKKHYQTLRMLHSYN